MSQSAGAKQDLGEITLPGHTGGRTVTCLCLPRDLYTAMRWGIVGFFLGIAVALGAVVLLQQRAIREVEPEISFRFDHYVFTETTFPKGDFQPGRLVHRFLFPSRYSVRFYDADYNEVTQADKPGRYGAVVRLDLAGHTAWRFITLYRTDAGPYWWGDPWNALGIDPVGASPQQLQVWDALRNNFVGRGDVSPQLAVLLAGLAEAPPTGGGAGPRYNIVTRDEYWWYGLREKLGLAPKYAYLADLPHDYDVNSQKRWPLIVYLHSGAERGSDLRLVRRTGLAKVMGDGKQLPAIVVSPQCPEGQAWSVPALDHLLVDICGKYRIDPARIYLTGGTETWTLAAAFPSRFAAIVPIGGKCESIDDGQTLAGLPVWAFISTQDAMTPPDETRATLDAMRKAGGHPHVTISSAGPDIWGDVYATEAIYPWLLAQQRLQPEVMTPGVPAP